MKIAGTTLASKILDDLMPKVAELQKQNLTPKLSVILVGNNQNSLSFIKRKEKYCEQIRTKLSLHRFPRNARQQEIVALIQKLNADKNIHGIIVQRPLPSNLKNHTNEIAYKVLPEKDIDGFVPNSRFAVPVALAILKTLDYVSNLSFLDDLKNLETLVLGRGETAGKPIFELLKKYGFRVTQAHSQTPDTFKLIKTTDVLISCIGKPNFIRGEMIKKGAIAIGVGLSTLGEKLVGDLEEESVAKVAYVYTPTPGGIGPINVACLLANLVCAVRKSSDRVQP